MSELAKRIGVAAIGIPVALFLIIYNDSLFAGAVAAVAVLGLHEFYKMARAKGSNPLSTAGIALGALFILALALAFKLPGASQWLNPAAAIAAIGVGVMALYGSALFARKTGSLPDLSATLGGLAFVVASAGSLVAIRMFDEVGRISGAINFPGVHWGYFVVTFFVTIWICDSGAYFGGRAMGRHKLFERVSPKKTWEGAITGFLFGVPAFWAFSFWLNPAFPGGDALILGALVSSLGQIGDLAESQLKRDAGVKDSGALLPGHGGALDRFDSIMFSAPFVLLYLLLR